MEIVLIANAETGQSAFPAEDIEGIPAPERRYNIVNGCMVLAGFSDAVLHHDADELLKQSVFRMPTPQEQEAMFQEAQQASTAQENAPENAPDTGEVSLDGEQTSPDSQPPALDNKKKASGG